MRGRVCVDYGVVIRVRCAGVRVVGHEDHEGVQAGRYAGVEEVWRSCGGRVWSKFGGNSMI